MDTVLQIATPDRLLYFFLVGFLPVFCTFVAERTFIFYLANKPSLAKWVKQQFLLHPNSISRMRYPQGLISVALYLLVSEELGIYWFSFWMITDVTDGSIARHCGTGTLEGQSIDPLSDKLLYFPPLFLGTWLGFFPLWLTLTYLCIDGIGQISRKYVAHTAANLYGKSKTFLTVICVMIPYVQVVYFEYMYDFGKLVLACVCILSFCSVFFRAIPNYWYANILSIMNFACGVVGIVVILMGGKVEWAFALVFLGQFLDLFDGRAAEVWGSTPNGEIFDDLADGMNFGGTIAVIIWYAFEASPFGIFLAILHFCCTVFRLVRFIFDKKEQNVSGGVLTFKGMPSPAGALLSGAAAIMAKSYTFSILGIESSYIFSGIILMSCILMVSKVPYAHFGRVVLPSIPKMIRVLLYSVILLVLLLSFELHILMNFIVFTFIATMLYVVFGPAINYRQNRS